MVKKTVFLNHRNAGAGDRSKRWALMRTGGEQLGNPQAIRGNGESAARGGGAILRLVAQTLFVAVFFHPLAAFVFCDF